MGEPLRCPTCAGAHSEGSSDCPLYENSIAQANDHPKFTLNALLCYANHHLKNCTKDMLKQVLFKHFTDLEVTEAKTLLHTRASHFLEQKVNRTGDNKKSREIDDIILCLATLDGKLLLCKAFSFVTDDLARLPRYGPEEMNYPSLLMRLSALESKMSDYDNCISQADSRIKTLEGQPNSRDNYAAKLKSAKPPNRANSVPFSTIPIPPNFPKVILSGRRDSTTSQVSHSSKRQRTDTESDSAFGAPTWNQVYGKGGKHKRTDKTFAKGRADNDKLKGGEIHVDIFVSHLVKGTTADELGEYLNDHGVLHAGCHKTSKDESRFDSFKVTIQADAMVKVCGENGADFWPRNVMCRRFYKPRPRGGNMAKADD
jgi:hypothetical protein